MNPYKHKAFASDRNSSASRPGRSQYRQQPRRRPPPQSQQPALPPPHARTRSPITSPKRTTARYRGTRAALWQPASAVRVWNHADTVTGDVTAVHGKEVYSNITINGMPASEPPNWGSWSSGEFATALLAILPPERTAAFTHQHAEQLPQSRGLSATISPSTSPTQRGASPPTICQAVPVTKVTQPPTPERYG